MAIGQNYYIQRVQLFKMLIYWKCDLLDIVWLSCIHVLSCSRGLISIGYTDIWYDISSLHIGHWVSHAVSLLKFCLHWMVISFLYNVKLLVYIQKNDQLGKTVQPNCTQLFWSNCMFTLPFQFQLEVKTSFCNLALRAHLLYDTVYGEYIIK